MIAKINKGVEQFQEFFDTNFARCDEESMEILLMLAYGHIFDIFTPNQLTQILGLNKMSGRRLRGKRRIMMLSTPGAYIT
jgi:hypothetical protein